MSISDIAMLVNDNFNKPLNAQIRDLAYNGSYLITSSTDFSPDKSGLYKVICVGRGGDSEFDNSAGSNGTGYGGAGGVAIKTMHLRSSEIYPIVVDYYSTSFNGTMIANRGDNGQAMWADVAKPGKGGTAEGGDFNYTGTSGGVAANGTGGIDGADVGVFIPGLMNAPEKLIATYISSATSKSYTIRSGYGILGYGGGQGRIDSDSGINKGGCVLIIPLELEE